MWARRKPTKVCGEKGNGHSSSLLLQFDKFCLIYPEQDVCLVDAGPSGDVEEAQHEEGGVVLQVIQVHPGKKELVVAHVRVLHLFTDNNTDLLILSTTGSLLFGLVPPNAVMSSGVVNTYNKANSAAAEA